MDQEGADNGLRSSLQRPALVLCQWQDATVVAEGDATWALRTHCSGSMPHPGKGVPLFRWDGPDLSRTATVSQAWTTVGVLSVSLAIASFTSYLLKQSHPEVGLLRISNLRPLLTRAGLYTLVGSYI